MQHEAQRTRPEDIPLEDRLRIAWTSCSDRVNDERAEAADEIERLRRERDEARLAYCREVLILYGDADEQYRIPPSEVARRRGWKLPELGIRTPAEATP